MTTATTATTVKTTTTTTMPPTTTRTTTKRTTKTRTTTTRTQTTRYYCQGRRQAEKHRRGWRQFGQHPRRHRRRRRRQRGLSRWHGRSRQARYRARRGPRLRSTMSVGSECAVAKLKPSRWRVHRLRSTVRSGSHLRSARLKSTRAAHSVHSYPSRAGQPIAARASAQAMAVAAILCVKSSSNASVMLFGGPSSIMLRSGMPWLSSRERERGRERLT